jgi:GAF domain-containing protein
MNPQTDARAPVPSGEPLGSWVRDIENDAPFVVGEAPPLVLCVGLSFSITFAGNFRLLQTSLDEYQLRYFREIAILVLGDLLTPAESYRILEGIFDARSRLPTIAIVLAAGPDTRLFEKFVEEDQVFFLCRGRLSEAQTSSIVNAAASRYRASQGTAKQLAADIVSSESLTEHCGNILSQPDLSSAVRALVASAQSLTNADRADLFLFDSKMETLSSGLSVGAANDEGISPASGIVGYAVRTGEVVEVPESRVDPRYDPDVDDPKGDGSAGLLVQPIMTREGTAFAVVSVAKAAGAGEFPTEARKNLQILAALSAPVLETLLLHSEIRTTLLKNAYREIDNPAEIFLEEALESHARAEGREANVLRGSPPWLRHTPLISLALLVTSAVAMLITQIPEYAHGSAVIHARNRQIVRTPSGGIVASLKVKVGDRVRSGDPIALIAPPSATLSGHRLDEVIRAQLEGIVSVVFSSTGQRLTAGDQVAEVVDESRDFEVTGFLPSEYTSEVRSGMAIMVTWNGYPDSHELLYVDVDTPPVQKGERVSMSSLQNDDGLIVRAPVPLSSFLADGKRIAYRDGLTGECDVTIGNEPLLLNLLPIFKHHLGARTAPR